MCHPLRAAPRLGHKTFEYNVYEIMGALKKMVSEVSPTEPARVVHKMYLIFKYILFFFTKYLTTSHWAAINYTVLVF
jgi:hypothetical protein